MNTFQLKIFKEINKENIGKNIIISPMSIYHILSLTTNGAKSQTLEEMLNAICHKDLKEMNENNKLISSAIETFKTVELANGVFTKYKPLDSFTKMIREYKATLDILKDVDQINKWCSDATHEKIKKIIDGLSPNDIMVLINAIYFKGMWEKTFEENETVENTFMNFNKEPTKVKFMNKLEN